MRIALETNVLISAFATRGLSADVLNLALADHQLVLGETVLGEFARILRTKLEAPADIIEETTAFLRTQAGIISSAPPLALTTISSVSPTRPPIRILNPRGFWDLLRTQSST